jgi:hypothetical protein
MICGSDGILAKPTNDNGKIANGSLTHTAAHPFHAGGHAPARQQALLPLSTHGSPFPSPGDGECAGASFFVNHLALRLHSFTRTQRWPVAKQITRLDDAARSVFLPPRHLPSKSKPARSPPRPLPLPSSRDRRRARRAGTLADCHSFARAPPRHGGLRARGGGRAQALEAARAPGRGAAAAPAGGDGAHHVVRLGVGSRPAAAPHGADGLRGGHRPGRHRHPRRAQLPTLRLRPPRPARAHPAADEGGRLGRRLRARRRARHPARALVAALHHAKPRLRRAPRRALGRAGAGEHDRVFALRCRGLALRILCPRWGAQWSLVTTSAHSVSYRRRSPWL